MSATGHVSRPSAGSDRTRARELYALGFTQEFGFIVWRQRLCFCDKCRHLCFTRFWWSRGAVRDRYTNRKKKLFLAGRGTDAGQTRCAGRAIAKAMGRICRYVNRFTCANDGPLPAKSRFDLPCHNDECFFEVVAMQAGDHRREGCAYRLRSIGHWYRLHRP